MLQAALLDGLSLDPFTFEEDGLAAAEVDVGRGEIHQNAAQGFVTGKCKDAEFGCIAADRIGQLRPIADQSIVQPININVASFSGVFTGKNRISVVAAALIGTAEYAR
jgi:hypothetical protein